MPLETRQLELPNFPQLERKVRLDDVQRKRGKFPCRVDTLDQLFPKLNHGRLVLGLDRCGHVRDRVAKLSVEEALILVKDRWLIQAQHVDGLGPILAAATRNRFPPVVEKDELKMITRI